MKTIAPVSLLGLIANRGPELVELWGGPQLHTGPGCNDVGV